MKKVSTAAAQPSRIFSQQKLTIGLDLGDRNSWFCVVDETGKIQLEQQVRASTKALQEVFGCQTDTLGYLGLWRTRGTVFQRIGVLFAGDGFYMDPLTRAWMAHGK